MNSITPFFVSFVLSLGMPGDAMLTQCDGSLKKVGRSTHNLYEIRPTNLSDIEFSIDATEWDREYVERILSWNAYCWEHHGCVVGDHYDPPVPLPKCGIPVS